MKFSNSVYNAMKYIVSIGMIAILGLWQVVAQNCDLNQIPIFSTNVMDFVSNIWTALGICLGALFCVENATYAARKNDDGTISIIANTSVEEATTESVVEE